MKFRLLVAGVGLVLVLALVVAVVVTRGGGLSATPTTTSWVSGPAVTSPYDFTEADTPVNFQKFAGAKFFSLTLDTQAGLKSYLLGRNSAEFSMLATALTAAREVAAPEGPLTTDEIGPSLTVVMPDRTTFTFDLAATEGLLVRDGQAWKLGGDVKTLLDSFAH